MEHGLEMASLFLSLFPILPWPADSWMGSHTFPSAGPRSSSSSAVFRVILKSCSSGESAGKKSSVIIISSIMLKGAAAFPLSIKIIFVFHAQEAEEKVA